MGFWTNAAFLALVPLHVWFFAPAIWQSLCSSALLLACGMCLFDLICTLLYFHHFALLSRPTSSCCDVLDVTSASLRLRGFYIVI